MTTERRSDGAVTHVQITEEGRVVAQADLSPRDPDTVQASLWAESGALPAGTRATLVDALLEEVREQPASHLVAAVPTGDAESLMRLQERCGGVQTRSAGATVFVEAEPPKD